MGDRTLDPMEKNGKSFNIKLLETGIAFANKYMGDCWCKDGIA